MPGRTDCLPLFWGPWVDGFERAFPRTLPLHVQEARRFPLCSFEAGISKRVALGVTSVPSLSPWLRRRGGWVSHFWHRPLRPLHRATRMVTPPSAPHCLVSIPKIARARGPFPCSRTTRSLPRLGFHAQGPYSLAFVGFSNHIPQPVSAQVVPSD